MRKHQTAADIAHSKNMRDIGPHISIRDNALRGKVNADVGKIQRREIRTSADCHQHGICNHLFHSVLLLVGHLKAFIRTFLHRKHLSGRLDIDPTLAESLLQTLCKVGIEMRQHILAVFKDSDLRTEAVENGCEFQADDSSADNAQPAWNMVEFKHFLRRDDTFQVSSGNRK